jgi:2-haloacid dehalogenase
MDTNTIKYLTFDCYGTLIDWERGIWSVFKDTNKITILKIA